MHVVRQLRPALAGAAAGALAILSACGISEDQEVALGQQNAAQVEAQLPLVADPAVTTYVQALGHRLARETTRPGLEWRFRVVNTDEVNAFALPGGFIYVNRGLIERMDTERELAGVLGHEIGHVALRHSVDQLEKQNATGVGVAVVCTLTGWCQDAITQTAINVGASAYFAKHGRDDEREADSLAVVTVVRAGLDPEGVPALFDVLLRERQRNPGRVEGWFASHPLEERRIRDTREQIAALDAARLEGLERDSPEFQAMKRRLTELPPAPSRPTGDAAP